MQKQIRQFRRRVEEHFGGRPGPGDRYPESLRALAVEVAAAELSRGEQMSAVAGELGVRAVTLRRWLGARPAGAVTWRAVEVVDEQDAGQEEVASTAELVLVTAAGHRIEGLHLAEVAWLLEALA